MPFEVIILICVLGSADCNEGNAVHVMKEHHDFPTSQTCYSYAMHKAIPLLQDAKDAFPKIKCKAERHA